MNKQNHHAQKNKRAQAGFTLVEMIVAGIIISVAIVAVATVARKSREIDVTFQHHRAARAIIDSALESAAYHYDNYDNLADVEQTVLIEDRGDSLDNISGKLTVKVTSASTNDLSANAIPYKEVAGSVAWSEPEGTQTITIIKAVPDLTP